MTAPRFWAEAGTSRHYLGHLYTRAYVAAGGGSDNSFCLYLKIRGTEQQKSINVLPDFMPPGRVRIASVRANGTM